MIHGPVIPFLYTKGPNSAHRVDSCVHLCWGSTHDSHVMELAYCPSMHEWIEKTQSTNTMRYTSTIKNNFPGKLSSY